MSAETQKRVAGEYAAGLVEDDMVVGLGTGSTAEFAIQALGRRVQAGLRVTGVPTSKGSEQLARSFGIRIARLDQLDALDLNIDGADEVDPLLNLVKGRGGALLREKLVADAARRFVVVVDEGKLVHRLGERAPVPVEVVPFGWTTTRHRLDSLGFTCRLRKVDGHVYVTSNHNYILDCHTDDGVNLADGSFGEQIKCQTGVVEHGLFLGMASTVIVGMVDGTVDVL
ncbi:MAG: ribose 5-phosphate isomerase A [Chloroflexota bacterium]